MSQVIRISSDLYRRLEQHAKGFDTPANVIERILDYYEGKAHEPLLKAPAQPHTLPKKLDIVLHPPDEEEFKSLLLDHKVAWVLLHMSDGNSELNEWNAQRFTSTSNVLRNLRSGYLRGWREKGIVKAEIAIDRNDIA